VAATNDSALAPEQLDKISGGLLITSTDKVVYGGAAVVRIVGPGGTENSSSSTNVVDDITQNTT
jgi:hypothetical protein